MVTLLFSVPLNEALASVTPTPISVLALAAFTASFVTLFCSRIRPCGPPRA
jgi:uncharacterized membrane protein